MPLSSYAETLDYLYRALPMFQRVGASAFKKDLNNTIRLCDALGNPETKFKSIHVAGTNGKGSVSHMLASVLQSAGYKVGLYTSPHLKEFTERIRINGEEVSQHFVVDFVNRIQPLIDEVQPSFFEITVAMAFDYFVEQKVDVAIVEVGLGGRLDSTNVITPELSVITNIGMDHKDLLGDTIHKIALEKAGIIKPGIPVVISEFQDDIDDVFLVRAAECNSEITFASHKYSASWNGQGMDIQVGDVSYLKSIELPLMGLYQQKNVPAVLQSCDVLNNRGFKISKDDIARGLENVVVHTKLKGRWQVLGTHPQIICDTGHNEEGIKEVLQQIHMQSFDNLYMVWGMVKDKDVNGILNLLPKSAYYIFCEADIPRALSSMELFEMASEVGLKGEVVTDVNKAISKAKQLANQNDLIFIGGSTFVVAEIDDL